jgi:purine-binding chemotaxis protein CheW
MTKYSTTKRLHGDQYIVFLIGSTRFGVSIHQALRITNLLPITRVPGAPSFLEGVVNDHSQVIPLIDLGKRMALPGISTQHADAARILMVEVENQVIGMLVSAVVGITRIPLSDILSPPSFVSQVNGLYLNGVVRTDTQLTMIINLDQVLTLEENDDVANWQTGESVE